MHHCAVGFSGVVFGLVVVDTALAGGSHRSIFGLFTVPAALYPWALLAFWQLLVPQASFLGHLAGVTVGGASLYNLSHFHTIGT
jgi:membrane associated rhomboid family serine protease